MIIIKIRRALDEGVEMKFDNDEQTKEFVITIPRKALDEPASNSDELASASDEPGNELGSNQEKEKSNEVEELSSPEKELSNQAEELSKGKSNEVEELSNPEKELSNQAEELSKGKSNEATNQVKTKGLSKKDLTGKQIDIINFCSVPRSAAEIMERLGITNQTRHKIKYILPLVEAGILKLTHPESATAPNQKYVKVKG